MRRDDGVGIVVARHLRDMAIPSVSIIEWTGDASGLIERFQEARSVYLIDAMQSGQPPGTVVRLEAQDGPLPETCFPRFSHCFSVSQAIEMARTLHQLPDRLVVFGIEGEDFSSGMGLSDPVAQAAERIAHQLAAELIVFHQF